LNANRDGWTGIGGSEAAICQLLGARFYLEALVGPREGACIA
jgi:hypothetical protein